MSLNPKITDWQGRRVWLMGASSGIGEALALKLASLGAKVAVSARRAERVADVVSRLAGHGHLAISCDAGDPAALAAARTLITAAWGGLDFAVYLAGDYHAQTAWDLSPAVSRQLCEVNYLNAVSFTHCVLPFWQDAAPTLNAERGLILVGSVAGYRGLPKALAYGPPKAALAHFAETLYFDLSPRKIGIWLVSPGFVATQLTAKNNFNMPALMTPDAAALALVNGLKQGCFEIHFPKRFTRILKLLRHLPDGLYFRLVSRMTGV